MKIKKIIYFTLALLFFSACGKKISKNKQDFSEKIQPNIIFLLADDQRNNTIRALGNNQVITPNLDRLVNEGTAFNNTYLMGAMNGAVCAPSRAMIMTGRALFNIDPTGHTIDSSHTTLPKALRDGGYNAFHIGKWHNGRQAFTKSFNDGSKIFFGGMHGQYNVPTYEYNIDENYTEETLNIPSKKHSSELYADAGIGFLENYESQHPFFMYIAFQAPHDPREMPQKYLDMYDTDSIVLPPNFMSNHPFDNGELDIRDEWLAGYPRTTDEIKANIAAYYAMITHLDEQIGRVLQTLEEKGLIDNTIIVYAGDNGLAVGQHGLMGKQNLYEHSINVPLIFKGPGIEKGVKKNSFAYLYDIYPTLCDFAGVRIPKTVEGKSLNPILSGEVKENRDTMFFAYKNFQRAVRNGRWKLIKYNVNSKITTQLFDLKQDPYETTNLAENIEYANKLEEMTELMIQKMKDNNDLANLKAENWGVSVLPAWKDNVDEAIVERLRKLALKERETRGFSN